MSDPIVLSAQRVVPISEGVPAQSGRGDAILPHLLCLPLGLQRRVFVVARYGFWSLNRFVLHQLYFLNRRRRHFGRRSASSANDADAFTRVYGSAAPGSLPESTEWWRRQSRELFASVHGSSNEAIAHARPRAVRELQQYPSSG